jgi:hypothetical protein
VGHGVGLHAQETRKQALQSEWSRVETAAIHLEHLDAAFPHCQIGNLSYKITVLMASWLVGPKKKNDIKTDQLKLAIVATIEVDHKVAHENSDGTSGCAVQAQ